MTVPLTDHHHFELRVIPDVGGGYGLALFQTPLPSNDGERPLTRVVQVWGDPLRAVVDQVLTAVKRAGYRATDLLLAQAPPADQWGIVPLLDDLRDDDESHPARVDEVLASLPADLLLP